jgi:hypothetical protein
LSSRARRVDEIDSCARQTLILYVRFELKLELFRTEAEQCAQFLFAFLT